MIKNNHDCDCNQQKRDFLRYSIAASALLLPTTTIARPIRQGITSLKGMVYINGLQVKRLGFLVYPNDYIRVGKGSSVSFVMGKDAYFLKQNTSLHLNREGSQRGFFATGLKLFRGAFLAAFGHRRKKIYTPHATIGIRGTGIYLNAESDQTYFCICYGQTEIMLPQGRIEGISATHHSARIIRNNQIIQSSMLDHHDQQNIALEALVQRPNPFN